MAKPVTALVSMDRKRHRGVNVLLLAALFAVAGVHIRSESSSATLALAPPPQAEGFIVDNAAMLAVLVLTLCSGLALTEVAQKPPAPMPIEKRADYVGVLLMSAFLSLLSGMVNAMAILDMGMTVAHHTGNTSHTGRLLGENAFKFFILMVAFGVGASVVGYAKSDGEAVYSRRFSPGMLSASIAVACGCLVRWMGGNDPATVGATLVLWAYSQGIQNAITRKCSSLPVCTTHMTGYLTDFGSGCGAALQAKMSGEEPNIRKPGFFGLSIFAFGAGGYAMKLARPHFGAQAVLAPAILMCAVGFGLVPIVESSRKKEY